MARVLLLLGALLREVRRESEGFLCGKCGANPKAFWPLDGIILALLHCCFLWWHPLLRRRYKDFFSFLCCQPWGETRCICCPRIALPFCRWVRTSESYFDFLLDS